MSFITFSLYQNRHKAVCIQVKRLQKHNNMLSARVSMSEPAFIKHKKFNFTHNHCEQSWIQIYSMSYFPPKEQETVMDHLAFLTHIAGSPNRGGGKA